MIAGAGGFGLEIYDYLRMEEKQGGVTVAGFIDDNGDVQLPESVAGPILGGINDFIPDSASQAVVVAIGSVKSRKAVITKLSKAGVCMPAYIHESAMVSESAMISEGVIVCPFSIINAHAYLAKGVVVNVHCSVGHEAMVGDFSILSPYAALNGCASIGLNCFLGTRSTIYPGVSIGNGCVVDSHAGVRSNVNDLHLISSRGKYIVNPIRIR